ncbi:MAG: ABC transporter permease subunit [Clostridia bacterium]|nr:ABC transporter permease subunit [Deltaproteobacteria bacterium]
MTRTRARPSEALPQALLVICTVLSALFGFVVLAAVGRGMWVAADLGAGCVPWVRLSLATLKVTAIAIVVALPLAFAATIAIREIATPTVRRLLRPWLTLLATMPPIVFAYGACEISRTVGVGAQLSPLTLGLLLAPFLTRLLDRAMLSAPEHLRDAALALGATRLEAWRQVLLPTAATQVASAVLFTTVWAVGEAVIVALVNPGIALTLAAEPMNTALYGRVFTPLDFANIAWIGLSLIAMTLVLHRIAVRLARL